MTILKYEMKKMICGKTSVSAIGLLVLLTVGLCIGYIHSAYYVREDGKKINGIPAIAKLREVKEEWSGPVTEEVVAKVITLNNELYQNPEYMTQDGWLDDRGYSRQQGYYDLRDLINDTYRDSFSDFDYFSINRLTPEDADDFYHRRELIYDEWLSREEVQAQFSGEKREYIREHALNLEQPYEYEYAGGWEKVKEMNVALLLASVVVICVVLASDFAVECQTGADAIYLSTRLGKRTGNKMKIAAGFMLATILYWGFLLIGDAVVLLAYGTSGKDTMIQLELWKSLYSLTQEQAWILTLLMGYLGCMAMSGLTMLLSSELKTAFGTIILSFLILMVPAIAGQSVTQPFWQIFFSLCPHGTIMSYDFLSSYTLYQIGSRIYTPFTVLPLLYIPLTALTVPFTYYGFQRYKA